MGVCMCMAPDVRKKIDIAFALREEEHEEQ